MLEKYKVVKGFDFVSGENTSHFAEGEIVAAKEVFTPEELLSYIESGNLELVVEDSKPEPIPYDGPMAEYRITGEAESFDEEGNSTGFLEVGSIQNLPEAVGDGFVESGVAEHYSKMVKAPEVDLDLGAGAGDGEVTIDAPKVKMFEGKQVISDTNREVNGKSYHTVRLEDGSSQDLTDEEYDLKVTLQDNA